MQESAAKAPTDTPITCKCLISPCCSSASAKAEHTLLPTSCESKLARRKFPRHWSQSYTSTYLLIPVEENNLIPRDECVHEHIRKSRKLKVLIDYHSSRHFSISYLLRAVCCCQGQQHQEKSTQLNPAAKKSIFDVEVWHSRHSRVWTFRPYTALLSNLIGFSGWYKLWCWPINELLR